MTKNTNIKIKFQQKCKTKNIRADQNLFLLNFRIISLSPIHNLFEIILKQNYNLDITLRLKTYLCIYAIQVITKPKI